MLASTAARPRSRSYQPHVSLLSDGRTSEYRGISSTRYQMAQQDSPSRKVNYSKIEWDDPKVEMDPYGGDLMTWRHLQETVDRRFAQVRAAILQRRDQLVAQLEMELLEHQRRRVRQLNARLENITDEANRRVVALLDGYSDVSYGSKSQRKRLPAFEAPYLAKPPVIVAQRRARVVEIDALTRRSLVKLDQLYDELLPYPDKVEALEKEDLCSIVDRLMEPVLPRHESCVVTSGEQQALYPPGTG